MCFYLYPPLTHSSYLHKEYSAVHNVKIESKNHLNLQSESVLVVPSDRMSE